MIPQSPPDRSEAEAEAERRALAPVPRGAAALAGLTVALLLLAWLIVYFLVYLPRGLVS